jgi:predicted ArsR family transcriptional regulator
VNIHIDDNTTRNSIIYLLKKSNGLSIEELSRSIQITPMGIRQHLLSLEKKGVVTYISKKHGIGRPGFVYMLTDSADDLFPKTYDRFAVEILNTMKMSEGTEKLDIIFRRRKDAQLKTIRKSLAGSEKMEDTLEELKKYLESEGYIVELNRNNGNYVLNQYNCPIRKIASEFRALCSYELQLYRELLSEDVTREHNIAEGSSACSYRIPVH